MKVFIRIILVLAVTSVLASFLGIISVPGVKPFFSNHTEKISEPQDTIITKIDYNSHEYKSIDIGDILPGTTHELIPGISYDITGYGDEFGLHNRACQGRFVYKEVYNDFDISAQVVNLSNDYNGRCRAHLMARKSLNARDLYASTSVVKKESRLGLFEWNDDSFYFQWRLKEGGAIWDPHAGIPGYFGYAWDETYAQRNWPNVWLRLRRTDNKFSSYWSTDGENWNQIGNEIEINMDSKAYVGMALDANPEADPNISKASVKWNNISLVKPQYAK